MMDVIAAAKRKYQSFFYRELSSDGPSGKIKTFLKLISLFNLSFSDHNSKNLGALWNYPSSWSLLGSLIGLFHNYNHLGNVYQIKKNELSQSQKIELSVIELTKKMLNFEGSNTQGYVTSGGTEANLFLMWMGREWLLQKTKQTPLLLVSNFTHYSIFKAGRILQIATLIAPVSEIDWGIDVESLEKNVLLKIKKGQRSFLLPLTLGYSSTGACDPISKIIEMIKQLKKEHSKVDFFVWIDGAMQGLPICFLRPDLKLAESSFIQGYIVDFHKLGRVPLPAGVVLFRENLPSLIEQKIDYLRETDSTISGSRPGFSSIAIWANMLRYSNTDWQVKFQKLHQEKERFLLSAQVLSNKYQFINTFGSLTICLVIKSKAKLLPQWLLDKYYLNLAEIEYHNSLGQRKKLLHYKIHFLSDQSGKSAEMLLSDLKKL